MFKFKPTVIATSAAIAFSTSVTAADIHNHQPSKSLKPIYKTAAISGTEIVRPASASVVHKATASGMRNQFDSNLNRATFVWSGVEQRKPNLTAVAPEEQAAFAADFYLKGLTGAQTNKASGLTTELKYIDEGKSGPIIAKYKQSIQGVEVFNKEYNVMMDQELNLVAGSGYLASAISSQQVLTLMSQFGSMEKAIEAAFADLSEGKLTISLGESKKQNEYKLFEATSSSDVYQVIGTPRAKQVFFEFKGEHVAAYYIEAEIAEKDSLDSTYYNYVVNARTGEILLRNDLRAHASDFTYRAYAHESGFPMEGPHGNVIPKLDRNTPDKSTIDKAPLITLSHYSGISTEDPWLAEDATTTSGNNVFAYADVVAPQGFNNGDIVAETTSEKTFDYQLTSEETANSFNNRKAAIVNMFYFNNFMHDFYYDFGFDEKAGNAQAKNYERGGVEGDPIEAQAQDYSGYNNANMSTPADGASPRMQQYLYNHKDAANGQDWGLTVTSHADLGLLSSTRIASFGPVQYAGVGGSLVRLVDGNDTDSGSVTDGCEPATNSAENGNALTGKVAVIDRGSCNFTAKVKHAQDAGAVAAIIVNNTDDGTPAPMGGEDDAVTIPSMGLNYKEGHSLYNLIADGQDVTVDMFSNFPLKDSSFDNGIIAHEWGHYIQNRLVGNASGLINFQGRAMGEGWADVHSLIFLVKDADRNIEGNDKFQIPYATGTYVEDFYFGIRRLPYTPNMDVNALMFEHIEEGASPNDGVRATSVRSPHDAGEIWATVLWDVYVGLLNDYDFAEAEKRFVTYLLNGYKMTPIAPTYTEARDAILAAMYASDKDDYTKALEAFARRGLGLDAVAPDRFSTNLTGVKNGFATKLATYAASDFEFEANYDGVEKGFCSADDVLDKGETGTISVDITNRGSETLSGVKVQFVVTSDHDVTLANDGMVTLPDLAPFQSASTGEVMITLNEAGIAEDLVIEARFPELAEDDDIVEPGKLEIASVVNYGFATTANTTNSLFKNMEDQSFFNDFKEKVMRGGEDAEGVQTVDTINTSYFQGFNPNVNFGEQTMLLLNTEFESDVAVETDYMQIGYEDDFSISFWHLFMIEGGYDGGVVEVSINDGDWIDATAAGATFSGGYTGELVEQGPQAIGGRMAYTGRNADFSTFVGNEETISFGSNLNGQTVRLRFRISSDSNTNDLGWFIDNVQVTNVVNDVFSKVITGATSSCDNSAPKLTVAAPTAAVSETATGSITASATDRNEDTISYSWTQTAGPDATITSGDSATLTFTPPSISEDTELTFQVTASDGMAQVSESVKVNISNVNPTVTPPPTSSSSGSSMGWLALVLAPFAWVRRRKQK